MKIAAAVLIALGIGIVIWGGFGFTTRDKVVDVGPIHATKDTHHDVPYGTVAGAALAIAGAAMLVKRNG
jgi:drug/metabolite transporter (DMT)-like permease